MGDARGSHLRTWREIVKRRPRWDHERLGPYLALTPTVALLGELGYGERADGLYQLSPDPELRARRHWWQINANL